MTQVNNEFQNWVKQVDYIIVKQTNKLTDNLPCDIYIELFNKGYDVKKAAKKCINHLRRNIVETIYN